MKKKQIISALISIMLVFESMNLTIFAASVQDREIENIGFEQSVSNNSYEEENQEEAISELEPEASINLASSIVNDANSYVGKLKYVSGGTSLTSGVDCGGFVCAIFSKWGYDLWGYRTSLRKLPTSIATDVGTNIDNALPGDIICYSGHVGIYAGNGLLINAANSKEGVVKKNYSYYGTVVAIKRVNGVVQSLPNTDTTPPTITNVYISDHDNTGYTVNCTITDNSRIDKVQFPTWTDRNGQDDLFWPYANVSVGTSTKKDCSYRVKISEHNNEEGWYNTHIYVWDASGNKTTHSIYEYIDLTPPVISDVKVTDVSVDGYTVSCTVTDGCAVDRVQFPSWTQLNDQDDIVKDWWNRGPATGTKSGTRYTYRVKRSEHNNELFDYATHIYAYDNSGNYSAAGAWVGSLVGQKQNLGDSFIATVQNYGAHTYLNNDGWNVCGRYQADNDNQKWKFERLEDGSYKITSKLDGLSLDCWGLAENETNIAVSGYHGGDNQRWYLYKANNEGYYIMPKISCGPMICLNCGSDDEGTNVKMYQAYGDSTQIWRINNLTAPSNSGSGTEDKTTEDIQSDTSQIVDFTARMYTVALGRQAESAGLLDWSNQLMSQKIDGAGIAQGFIFSQEFQNRNLSNSDYLDTLYKTFFDRKPDAGGKAYWLNRMQAGTSRKEVLSGFVNSQEFSNLCDAYGIARGTMQADGSSIYRPGVRSFVLRMYTKALKRDGETLGVEDWTNRINTGVMSPEAVAKSFFGSEEFVNKNLNNADYVETLYQTFMDRASDKDGKAYWVAKLGAGASRESVLEGFSRSQEFTMIMKRYGL